MSRSSSAVKERPVTGFRIVEAPSIQPGDDLTLMQRLAVLGMMYSTVARGIAHRIGGDTQDRPSWNDYLALVDKGLCIRPVNGKWHQLTNEGRDYAKAMLARLCRENNIHVMDELRSDEAVSFRCSCGRWSSGSFRSNGMHAWRRAHNSFLRHLPVKAKAEST